jgi:hypothetical protein
MTVPGVGVVVALTYWPGVDAPESFSKSRDVGAHFGLTPKRHSSGQTDYDGRISRCGDEDGPHSLVSGSERSAASRPMVVAPILGHADREERQCEKRGSVTGAKVASHAGSPWLCTGCGPAELTSGGLTRAE